MQLKTTPNQDPDTVLTLHTCKDRISCRSMRNCWSDSVTVVIFVTASWLSLIGLGQSLSIREFETKPKLVLFIVIDQFRADYLTRFQHRFLPARGAKKSLGGFRYLMEEGAWFPQAQFALLQSRTGPGHSALLTGAYPYLTGISNNEWLNSESGERVYCTADSSFTWLSGETNPNVGTSPKNLIGTTLGDELKMVSPKSRVVSISLKDRSAILMGGKTADVAVWMDPTRSQWTSTKYYFPDGNLPSWVRATNKKLEKRRQELVSKTTEKLPLGLTFLTGAGIFPGGITWGDKAAFSSPAGLVIQEELVEIAIDELKLGQGKAPDLLTISFSTHDYAGHLYGPNGAAMEEMTVAEDVLLSRLFNFLANKIPGGMRNILIVLTADHGVAPNPEWAKIAKIDAGRVDENALKVRLDKMLTEKYGKASQSWIIGIQELNVYLNNRAIVGKKLEKKLVEDDVKSTLLGVEGIARAFSYSDYIARHLPPGIFQQQILNSYYPGRSGDVVAIIKPYFISNDETADHQTGYSYDRTIPIVFAGRNIRHGVHATPIEPIDIAPTLAFVLGIIPPSQSEGRIVSEIFDGKKVP